MSGAVTSACSWVEQTSSASRHGGSRIEHPFRSERITAEAQRTQRSKEGEPPNFVARVFNPCIQSEHGLKTRATRAHPRFRPPRPPRLRGQSNFFNRLKQSSAATKSDAALRLFRLTIVRNSYRSNCASNAIALGLKSMRFTYAAASVAPCSRSMRLSSHSTLSGPW
jgi:hypothetical protein